MEFVFGLEDVHLLARQHAAGLPGGGAKERGEELFKVLGEMGGFKGLEGSKNLRQRPGAGAFQKGSNRPKPTLPQRLGA